jgi:diguanylate cyclase (GGDEF)-like protein/PAS domain S-box-containing protein
MEFTVARPEHVDNESQRMETLRRFRLLDTPAEDVYDKVTRLVAGLFDAPIALITLVDEDRQWFKSRYGDFDMTETHRALAFCDHAIRRDEVMVVPDATLDPRFRDNAFVLGEPKIRFYAGAPLVARDGTKIGTVCVIDRRPRNLNETQIALLGQLSDLVMVHFEMRLEMLQTTTLRNELSAVVDASPSAIVTERADGLITAWNDAATSLFGWTSDETIGAKRSLFLPEFGADAGRLRVRVIERGETVSRLLVTGLHKNGQTLELSISAKAISGDSGPPTAATYVIEDMGPANRFKEIEQRRYDILELAANDAPLGQILEKLIDSVEVAIPHTITTILRLRGDKLFHEASSRLMPAAFIDVIEGLKIGPREGSCGAAAFRGEPVIVTNIAQHPFWTAYRDRALASGLVSCWSFPIRSGRGQILGTLAIYTSECREPTAADLRFLNEAAHLASIAMETSDARLRLEQMALCDALTELPNRAAFDRRLELSIASSRQLGKKLVLGVLDLNRFKLANDRLGHANADLLLKEVAARLARAVRPQDFLARVGGDEFLLLLTSIEDRAQAEALVRAVLGSLDESFMPAGHEIFVRATVGISMFPDDTNDQSQLLRWAYAAVSAAKSRGDAVGFHSGRQPSDGLKRLSLETHLNRALENAQFELHYQPQVKLHTGEIFGAEALLRWNHPDLGLVMPDRFIRIAEETGLIISIGTWVIQEACRFGRRWRDAGGSGIVSVNVSPRQFETGDLVEIVASALEESGLPPECLWIEITESVIMRFPETAAAKIAQLQAMGVRSFIDDFGTGYSSLNHLKRFPVAGLKIDRSFLRDIGGPLDAGGDLVLVRAVLAVGRAMNLTVVAEGVETAAQHDFLANNRCEIAQGYLYSRPVPESEFLRRSATVAI